MIRRLNYSILLTLLGILGNPAVNRAQTEVAPNHCFKHKRVTLILKDEKVGRQGEFLGTLEQCVFFDQEKAGPFFNPAPKMYLFEEIARIQLANGPILFDETVNLIVADCNEILGSELENQKKAPKKIFYTQLGLGIAAFVASGSDVRPGFLLGTTLETIKTTRLVSTWNLTFSLNRTHIENSPIRQYDGNIEHYHLNFNFLYLSLAYHLALLPFQSKNTQLFFGPSCDIAVGEFSSIAKSGSQPEARHSKSIFHRIEDPGPESMDNLINSGFGLHLGVSHRTKYAKVELRYSLSRPEVARPAFSNGVIRYSAIGIEHYLHQVWLIWNFEV